MKNIIIKQDRYNGYVTLISVIIVGAVILSIVLFMISSGLDATENSLVITSSTQAKFLADACAEEALQQIRGNTSFVGTYSVIFGANNCSYSVVNTGASTMTVNASSTVINETRKVRILVSAVTPKITLSSWAEVAN